MVMWDLEPSDPLTTPPVFWTEVFSRPDSRWLPVDPIRAIVNKRKVFDPTPVGTSSRLVKVDNRMTYVLAVEEDGYMRDVTPRYAKQYSAKVSKVQSGGRGRREWWEQVVQTVTRPYKLVRDIDAIHFSTTSSSDICLKHRDDVEDDELVVNQFTEGMPTTLGGFKDHPLCAASVSFSRVQAHTSLLAMCWNGTCCGTRSSPKMHPNSARSAVNLSILAAMFCTSKQQRTGCALGASCVPANNHSSTSNSARQL